MTQQTVNILRKADIYNCTDCIHDSKLGYSIAWDTNNDLNGYDVVDGITAHTVWDGVYFGVSVSGSCYFSNSSTLSVDASVYDTLKIKMRIDPGHHVDLPTLGKVQFKTSGEDYWSDAKAQTFSITADKAYREYSVDLSTLRRWYGTVNALRIYPFIDGVPGTKLHIKYLKIESKNTYGCSAALTGSVCDMRSLYEHPCPWVGSPGSSLSSTLSDGITIQQGVNDKIIVNIDGYGQQAITLRPIVGASIKDIARDIQEKLNLVGVGGYSFARCFVEDSRLKICSDWNNSGSSVIVSQPSVSSAGIILGFFNSAGEKISTETAGTNSASRYTKAPAQISSSQIWYLKNNDIEEATQSAFVIDGSTYVPQGGNSTYREFPKDTKISFRNQTLIDYDNPINQNGTITFIGYSGDSFSNTEFRIYRQKLNGVFTLISSTDMPSEEDTEDLIFEKSVSIKVKRGDLLALYSAAVHSGSDYSRPDYTYILYDGNLATGTRVQPLSGSGETGLPLFARGADKNTKAILQVDFDDVQPMEAVVVKASEGTVVEEINLCTLRNGGLNGGPYITGSTGLDSEGVQAPSMQGLAYLIDGVKQDINTESSCCYPGWLDLSLELQTKYTYTDFQIVFDFAKGVDVYFPIYRIKMYFAAKKNVKSFRWEIPTMTNITDTVRLWGIGWDQYDAVNTEWGLLGASTIYLYDNPTSLIAGDYQVSYAHLGYKFLDLIFQPYSARSIRYNATLGDSVITNTSSRNYSYFPVAPDPRIQEIEIFSKSTPESSVASSFTIETSKDGTSFVRHDDSDELELNRTKYIIGRPTRKLKITLESTGQLSVYDIYAYLTEDDTQIDTNYYDRVNLNIPYDDPDSDSVSITITNDSSSTSNFVIDILEEDYKNERCTLWNKLDSDTSVERSEVGPGGIVRRRAAFYLRPYNYAYGCPGYVLDRQFFFGRPCFVSRDDRVTWLPYGSVITNGSNSTYITNENTYYYMYPKVYVAVDLGDTYDLSSLTKHTPSGFADFSSTIMYSNKDTTNPAEIPLGGSSDSWASGVISNARWVLFQAPSKFPGDTTTRAISYFDVALSIYSSTNKGKLPWKSAEGYLTNGVSGYTTYGDEEGWINSGQSDYFCVDLGWPQSITNIIIGPFGIAADSIDSTDDVAVGVWPSIIDATYAGSDVAYSSSTTSDPSKVSWGSFGAVPGGKVRWVLVRSIDYRVEEIIVHVGGNVQSSKKSYLPSKWFTSSVTDLYEDFVNTRAGLCSICMDYPAGSTDVDYMLLKQNLGIDTEMAARDALSFWLYVSDKTQMDSSFGYFQIGTSTSQENTPLEMVLDVDDYNYYRWNIADWFADIESGWNYLCLPFSDNYKFGDIYFTREDKTRIGSYSARDRITNVKFAFKGKSNGSGFTVRLDDFKILRRYFSEASFGNGIYLPYGEYVKFLLSDFNPVKGTIEFYLKPDWTKSPLCNSCDDPREHTILRIFSTEDNSVFGLFMTGDGLKFYIYDGSKAIVVTDNSQYVIESDTPTHVALVWDFESGGGSAASIYINNVIAATIEYEDLVTANYVPDFKQCSIYTLFLGGFGFSGFVSSYVSSADAVIENLKMYNYVLTDFSYSMENQGLHFVKRSGELLKISLDNTTFYSSEDRGSGLPLIKTGIATNQSFNVYVRGKDLDLTLEGDHNRQAFITVGRLEV